MCRGGFLFQVFVVLSIGTGTWHCAAQSPGLPVLSRWEFVTIPSGDFQMGCSPEDRECGDDEKPAHRVRITRSFELGKYEVTQAQWETIMGANPSEFKGPERPVERVSWNDIQDFLRKVNGRNDGYTYRLPTEAEWEYAARAGSTTAYPWGVGIKQDGQAMANCDGCGSRWDGKQTAPAGSFAPNAFGLHDMQGNVWEWVEDCWNENYNGAPADGSAWTTGDCSCRVVRGGAWDNPPQNLRSACRLRVTTGFCSGGLGFRVGRTLTISAKIDLPIAERAA